MKFISTITGTFLLILFGANAMANEMKCESVLIAAKLKKQYAESNIDTSKYLKLDSQVVASVVKGGAKVCIIHDRINDLVHSYSITLYKDAKTEMLYLIYEGGFAGNDSFGFGPI